MKYQVSFAVFVCCIVLGLLSGCTDNKNFKRGILPAPAPGVTTPGVADTTCTCGSGGQVQQPVTITVDTTLASPVFSVKGSLQPYGRVITLLADSLPPQAVLEYSWDNGKKWNEGDSLVLCRSGTISARIRISTTTSPIVREGYTLYYKKVLIVGNSITGHGPAPEIGWTGDWGMAASRADSDYVHRLTRRLKFLYPEVKVKVYNAVPFEADYANYPLQKADEFADFKPDLIIMRIAENASVNGASEGLFRDKYEALIRRLLPGTDTKVVCTTSFWPDRYETINAIRTVAIKNKYDLVDIGGFYNDKSYTAQGLFKDLGVARHPSDKGMRAIYEAILTKL